jgi:hypothetical protein
MLVIQGVLLHWSWRRWAACTVLSLAPSAIFGSIYIWSIWGSTPYYAQAVHHSNWILSALQGFQNAVLDFYAGTTHLSFWGIFGCLDAPLVIDGPRATQAVRACLGIASWIFLALTLLRLENVTGRILAVGKKAGWVAALRLLFSNPIINSYFLFTGFMVLIYVRTDNAIGAQGRQWFPFLMPVILTALTYAPRGLTSRINQRLLAKAVAAGLALYVMAGSYYALRSVRERYYGSQESAPAQHAIQSTPPSAQGHALLMATTRGQSSRGRLLPQSTLN